jgi:hypothetical protein
MSNFPTLSADAIDLLLHIQSHEYQARGPRLKDSKARRELKRHSLIYSRPLNANPLLPAAAGHGSQWRPTPFGYEIAVALKRERLEQAQAS